MANKIKMTSLFSVKSFSEEDETIEIEGLANSTSKDRTGDVVLEEAWTKGGLDNFKSNPIVLFQHKHDQPIGTVSELSVTDQGLHVSAKIIGAAGNVFKMIKGGVLKAFSVSFMIKDADYDSDRDLFFIKDLEMLELSVVSVPMNADSVFSLKKSFDSEKEFEDFKKGFIKEESGDTADEDKLAAEAIAEEAKRKELQAEFDKKIQETVEESIASTMAALEESKKEEKQIMDKIETVEGSEKLLAELEARVKAAEETAKLATTAQEEEKVLAAETKKAFDELQADLKEKGDELNAMHTQKEIWTQEQSAGKLSTNEIDNAVLVAKLMGKDIQGTQYFANLRNKVGAHLASMTEDWESEFSTRVWDDIRNNLVVERMFEVIQMNTPTMHLPVNPEATLGTWIGSAAFRSSDGTSTGADEDHLITDETMIAYKLVAKEYLGYEEEEDSIIPLVPIVRAAVARRMARSADIALLRGAASGATDPIAGLTDRAATDGNVVAAGGQPSIGASDTVTVAMLQATRRLLGNWGTNPTDVVYIVSLDAYYDLLEDPDFRTIDMVGSALATILKGQIGFANGSPIVVSNEFAAKGAAAPCVVAVNTMNFKVGNLRTLMVERDRNIEDQKNILVASRRMAFHQIIVGDGVATLSWKA